MDIPILASIDDSTTHINRKVFPLTIDSLKDSRINETFHGYVLSRLRSSGFFSTEENVVLSISFNPKSCIIPFDHCSGSCCDCQYNPLPALFDPYRQNRERQIVITGRDTIDTLLDLISLLAKANKSSFRWLST
jgi:hypothetical protein